MPWNMKIVGPGTRYGYPTSEVPSRVVTVEDASKIVHAWFPNSWSLIGGSGALGVLEVRVNVHKVADWRRKMRALRRELRRKMPMATGLIVRPGRHRRPRVKIVTSHAVYKGVTIASVLAEKMEGGDGIVASCVEVSQIARAHFERKGA